MRYIEVRRHSKRDQAAQSLSREGVAIARKAGEGTGPFAKVVTSDVTRAIETAIAMGYAIDERMAALGTMGGDVSAGIHWEADYAEFSNAFKNGGALRKFAESQAALWSAILESVSEGSSALVITHGGIVQAGAVACLPDADHRKWGPSPSFCEGVRLAYENGKFVSAEIIRA